MGFFTKEKEILSVKEVAKKYMLHEIVAHELILEALEDVTNGLNKRQLIVSENDIIDRICFLCKQHKLYSILKITKEEILNILHEEYSKEIGELANKTFRHY